MRTVQLYTEARKTARRGVRICDQWRAGQRWLVRWSVIGVFVYQVVALLCFSYRVRLIHALDLQAVVFRFSSTHPTRTS